MSAWHSAWQGGCRCGLSGCWLGLLGLGGGRGGVHAEGSPGSLPRVGSTLGAGGGCRTRRVEWADRQTSLTLGEGRMPRGRVTQLAEGDGHLDG